MATLRRRMNVAWVMRKAQRNGVDDNSKPSTSALTIILNPAHAGIRIIVNGFRIIVNGAVDDNSKPSTSALMIILMRGLELSSSALTFLTSALFDGVFKIFVDRGLNSRRLGRCAAVVPLNCFASNARHGVKQFLA